MTRRQRIGTCALAVTALALPGAAASRTAALHLVSVGTFDHPTDVVSTPADPSAIYVVEQPGKIVRAVGEKTSTFLDLSSQVTWDGEQGLLSLAFSPGYAKSRLFYVDYTATNGNTVVAEYRNGARGPVRRRTLLDFHDPASNHNGGELQFGPDGMLWWGNGDGGQEGDAFRNGQRATGWFSKIFRLDTSAKAVRWKLWAVGLRNPWRFSFDRTTGALYIGDVGQNRYEEIDYVPKGRSHLNFGWDTYEGNARYGDEKLLPGWKLTAPALVYPHAQGCSVTGGYVYRGTKVPAEAGRYLYGDYCTGTIWSFRISANRKARDVRTEPVQLKGISAFGEDAAGELLVASVASGAVYRLS
jgi:glucose/arabinose dehydrogenase